MCSSDLTFVVKVLPDRRVKLIRVKLLGNDGDWQAIEPQTQGELQADDALVVDGADRLRDGSRVDVVSTLTPALPSAQVQPEPRGAQRNASAP